MEFKHIKPSKTQFINELKDLIKTEVNGEYDSIKEDYFEWDINNWRTSKESKISPEFWLCGYKWELKINKNYSKLHNSLNYFDVTLKNKDNNDKLKYNCVVAIRDNNSYLNYIAKEMIIKYKDKYCSFDKDNYKNAFKSLLKNDVISVTVYIRTYINSAKEKKDIFLNTLNHMLDENISNENISNYELIGKDYYEWKIENWNNVKFNEEAEYSPKFNICGYNWKLKLHPNGNDNSNDYVSFYLKNLDFLNNNTNHIFVKCILFISNYENYKFYHEKKFTANFHQDNNTDGIKDFIERENLYNDNNTFKQPIIENNKVIIGAYLSVYKYNKVGSIIKELKDSIIKKNTTNNDCIEENYYEWSIDNWKLIKSSKKVIYSPEFEIGGYKWKIHLYPNGNYPENRDYISLYLHNENVANNSFAHILLDYSLYMRNYKDYSCFNSIQSENSCNYNDEEQEHGKERFIKLTDLYIKNKITNIPIIEDNKIVIGTYIRIYRYDKENLIKDIKSLLYNNNRNVNDIIDENHCEWKIDNWDNIKNKNMVKSPAFFIGNNKWDITIYPNGYDKEAKDYVSFNLTNLTIKENDNAKDNNNLYTSFAYYIRNKNNYYYYYSGYNYNLGIFNKKKNNYYLKEFIEKEELCKINQIDHQSLVEDNKVVIGVYICIYKRDNFDKFINNMKKLIDDSNLRDNEVVDERFFEEELDDWEETSEEYEFENDGNIGNYLWRCILQPYSYSKNGISLSLRCAEFDKNVSDKMNNDVYIKFVLYIRNYKNFNYIKTEDSGKFYLYNKSNKELGIKEFINRSDLYLKNNHLLEDNKLVYGAYIRVYKNKPKEKIINKDFKLQFQSDDKTNGGGIVYHYDENGDLDVKLYGYKVDPLKNNIEVVDYKVNKLNTDNPHTEIANQTKININDIEDDDVSSSSNDDYESESESDDGYGSEIKNGDTVIALSDYKGKFSYELDFNKNEQLVITDWKFKPDYAMGYKLSNTKRAGLIPKNKISKKGEYTNTQSNNQSLAISTSSVQSTTSQPISSPQSSIPLPIPSSFAPPPPSPQPIPQTNLQSLQQSIQPYSSQPYSSQTYSPQPYSPQPYSSQPYSPQPYSSQPYSPQPYSPQPYIQPTPLQPSSIQPVPPQPSTIRSLSLPPSSVQSTPPQSTSSQSYNTLYPALSPQSSPQSQPYQQSYSLTPQQQSTPQTYRQYSLPTSPTYSQQLSPPPQPYHSSFSMPSPQPSPQLSPQQYQPSYSMPSLQPSPQLPPQPYNPTYPVPPLQPLSPQVSSSQPYSYPYAQGDSSNQNQATSPSAPPPQYY
ncbi:hypothetical protein BCR32DRAFT_267120 [Anaeromyces robustus]|uniref:MATH domain-containing protein n=1 Tax=Anaeromyces robustus TaxID=1754192 RepID=A0A1Y1XBZ4_9FUNG|nr:hypothetical protein BCR32DRAFT_267120 [Anaeromyces robustus]|eukprot:ORX83233.1 hypothetical protein BCR32DRAFT_267120 [Anaeromyces robustus]